MNAVSSVTPASSPSRNRLTGFARGLLAAFASGAGYGRFAVGPLALAGFFLPWASGPGPLAGTEFTGFTLVGFAGRLQALELSIAAGGMLLAVRLAILGVAVAASWQTLLAPAHRAHPGYAWSGWYLVAAAAIVASLGVARSGIVVPPLGLALVVAAGALFLAGGLRSRGLPSGD